jgi:hypothetical protein
MKITVVSHRDHKIVIIPRASEELHSSPMKLSFSGDRLFTVAAVGLAAVSGGFGGLMVVRLERMENPPLMMGLDFSSLQADAEVAADPIQTGTIGRTRTQAGGAAGNRRRQQGPQSLEFRLVSVVDGVAFVEVAGPGGTELWPVDVGATLPGAGQVTRISRDRDRWQLDTTTMTINGER